DEELFDKSRKVDLKLTDESEDLHSKKETEGQSEKDPHEGQIDHIETMIRGHLDHTKPEEHGDKASKLKKTASTEEEREKTRDIEENFNSQQEDEDLLGKSEVNLKLVDDP